MTQPNRAELQEKLYLHHLGVDVEAGVAQLGDLLGQELHPLSGVTEDDGLVDLELEAETQKPSGYSTQPLKPRSVFSIRSRP